MSFADVVKENVAELPAPKTKEKKVVVAEPVVVEPLHAFLKDLDEVEDDRAPGLHVSSMFYVCPRQFVIETLNPGAVPDPIDSVTRARFDIGHAMHDWYQNKYLGPMGILKGAWKCTGCGKRFQGFMPKEHCDCKNPSRCEHDCIWPKKTKLGKICQLCPRRPNEWKFMEIWVRETDLGIVGSSDGIIDRGEEHVLEMKTIDPDMYRNLTDAYAAHKYQTRIYMWLLGIPKGVVLYIEKSARGPRVAKEFSITQDPAVEQDVRRKVGIIKKAMADRVLPPCEGKRLCACDKIKPAVWEKALENWGKMTTSSPVPVQAPAQASPPEAEKVPEHTPVAVEAPKPSKVSGTRADPDFGG